MMKKIALLIVIALSFNMAYSQSCLPEGITFSTQEQIDNFQFNYPGCMEIEGYVKIRGNDITNLDGLNLLTYIGEDLWISSNTNLTSIEGLENLEFIGGGLSISSCENLSTLSGLENLYHVGEYVNIEWNDGLTSLAGIGNLSFIGSNLLIRGNHMLTQLTGLEQLSVITGYLHIDANSGIYSLEGLNNLVSIGGGFKLGDAVGNHYLSDLGALENLTSIGGAFTIRNNNHLVSLNGLESLVSVGGNLEILANDALLNLTGLGGLNSIDGDLIIQSNGLTSLDGLDQLDANSIDSLTIVENTALADCEALSLCAYLASPNGKVTIHLNAPGCNNPPEIASACGFTMPCLPYGDYYFHTQEEIDDFQSNYPGCSTIAGNTTIGHYYYESDITDLSGLNNVSSIELDLFLGHNPILQDLQGLENLETIGGDLLITGGTNLLSLSGLDGLTTINGNASIYGAPDLNDLSGLAKLNFIGGTLSIQFANSLQDLTGLDSLHTIGGSLMISYNDSLISLNGLENLISMGAGLRISNNFHLMSLSGLENCTLIGGKIYISGNSSLTDCTAQGICDYLAAPADEVTISQNGSGCNSVIEVGDACGGALPCLPYGNYYFLSQTDIDHFQSVFPGCSALEGYTSITGEGIINLIGLNTVESVRGDLNISNTSLVNFSGLSLLNFIEGDEWVIYNELLESLTGLEELDSIGASLYIYENNVLGGLQGLEGLHKIDGSLYVGQVGYGFCAGNPTLEDLTSLSHLTFVGGELQVACNPYLGSLAGLENISPDSLNALVIQFNDILSQCEVQSICDYLAAPNGSISIHGNAAGCNSEEEVEEACLAVGEEEFPVPCSVFRVKVYPNPTYEIVHIEYEIRNPSPVRIQVFNAMGGMVAELSNGIMAKGQHQIIWNATNLPAGIYLCRVQVGGDVAVVKALKH